MRAILDPGVLISAAVAPRRTCALILKLLEEGRFELVVSPKLATEWRETLRREKFRRWTSLEPLCRAMRT